MTLHSSIEMHPSVIHFLCVEISIHHYWQLLNSVLAFNRRHYASIRSRFDLGRRLGGFFRFFIMLACRVYLHYSERRQAALSICSLLLFSPSDPFRCCPSQLWVENLIPHRPGCCSLGLHCHCWFTALCRFCFDLSSAILLVLQHSLMASPPFPFWDAHGQQ